MPEAPAIHASLLEMAVELAHQAGTLLLERRAEARLHTEGKKNVNDLVTAADRASERLIVERIRAARPSDGIIGEEGNRTNPESPIQWVIDPLDGTMNYVHGCGPFAVSIGVEVAGEPQVGVVRVVLTEETFSAIKGNGAYCNGKLLSASKVDTLATAVIGFDGATEPDVRKKQATILSKMLSEVRDFRRIGSCATSMCWAAAGRFDAFFQHGSGHWDISAGTVIAREAGAWVGSRDDDVPTPAETLVAAPGISDALRKAIKGA